MQTTIELQESFSYLTVPIVITFFFIIILIYYKKLSKKEKIQVKTNMIPQKNIKNVPVIKEKYLSELNKIEQNYLNNEIDLRKAYYKISEAIRLFVFEITDITTQNYSLKEIKKLNIPVLYELIKEYYEPEFAIKSIGDLETSINKARRVIKEWN